MPQVVAAVGADECHALVGHPARIKVRSNEVEYSGFDIDAGEVVNIVHEKAASRLARAHADDQNPLGIGMQ